MSVLPASFISKVVLLVALLVLILNLYQSPSVQNECQKHFEEILNQIHIIDPYPHYKRLLREFEALKSSEREKEIFTDMKQVLKELRSLDAFERKEGRFQKVHNTNTDARDRDIITTLNNIEHLLTNYVNISANISTQLEKIQRDQLHHVLIMIGYRFREARKEAREMNRDLKIIQSQQAAMMIDKNPESGNQLELKELTSVLDARDFNKEAVYFTETTGTGQIKPRFVCGVESAAMAYPNGDIYLIFAYLPTVGLQVLVNAALSTVLKYHKNIQLLYVDMDKLFLGSILEQFHKSGTLNTSRFIAAHSSDVIRTLIIDRYGGKYFDLDIITVKNLTGVNNFVVPEVEYNGYGFANTAFGIEKQSPVTKHMLEILNSTFDGEEWGFNGPKVISDAMFWYTGVNYMDAMTEANLKGFKILPYRSLFPIDFLNLESYFNESSSEETMRAIDRVNNLWGIHVGNNLMHVHKVKLGSKQPYGLLAQKYCPRAYWSCVDEF